MAARTVLDVMTAMVVFRRLALKGSGLDDQYGASFGGLMPRVSPRSAQQMPQRSVTSRPGLPGPAVSGSVGVVVGGSQTYGHLCEQFTTWAYQDRHHAQFVWISPQKPRT